jgi:hypothetical protein
MKKSALWACCLLYVSFNLFAQHDNTNTNTKLKVEDKAKLKAITTQAESFEQFVQGQQKSFDNFLAQRDHEFLQMLTTNWAAFKQMQPLVPDPVPKPKQVPVKKLLINKSSIKQSPIKQLTVKKNDIKVSRSPNVTEEATENKTHQRPKSPHLTVNYFGHVLSLPVPPKTQLENITQKGLSVFWQQASSKQFDTVFSSLSQKKQRLAFSDWAYWLLIKKYSESQSQHNNHALALSWFLLNKTGYQTKIAMSNGALVLLMATEQPLYSIAYYKINGERYYHVAGEVSETITSYQGVYENSNNALDLAFDKTLLTKPTIKYRQLTYTNKDNTEFDIKLPYDYQRVRYFATYPQIDLHYYFKAPLDKISEQGLKQALIPVLKGDKHNKLNQLLSFMHKSFPYAVDEQQFGKENYLLIEETLHYQASDCEDRAILFAWLAKHILTERVVGLNYPGHVSVGIKRHDNLLSADPTYIGAVLGDIMPKYQDIQPKVIEF